MMSARLFPRQALGMQCLGAGCLASARASAERLALTSLAAPLPVKQKIIRRTSRMNWRAACTARNREIVPMIRLTKSEEGERTVITIDGQLSGDYIQGVE